MVYEVMVLSVNQKQPSSMKLQTDMEVHHEIENEFFGRYESKWHYYCNTPGIQYIMCTPDYKNKGFYWGHTIVTPDYDIKMDIPFWWSGDEHIKEIMTSLVVIDEYREDFEKVIRTLIEESPLKTVLFLTRYQGGDTEIIQGTLSPDQFFKALDEGKISFNVCYIISTNKPEFGCEAYNEDDEE